MRLLIHGRSGPRRKGVILLVVLSMLTLFALVGVSFVLVSGAQATSGRIALEAEGASRPDVDAEAAFALFMGQFLYDVPDDATGIFSALRGHSLARNLYGWTNDLLPGINPNTGLAFTFSVLNDKPYNGTGRLHSPTIQTPPPTAPATSPLAQTPSRYKKGVGSTDAGLMNYFFFPNDFLATTPFNASDNPFPGSPSNDFVYTSPIAPNYNPNVPSKIPYLRDPERPGFRQGFGDTPKPYAGGFGVPYTYPDHNNFYLAEIDPTTGQVIVPSFHRPYLFGPLDLPANPPGPPILPNPLVSNPYPFPGPPIVAPAPPLNWNPNWTNGQGKYLTLRPRRFENLGVAGDPASVAVNPNIGPFPMPLDGGGDVKNLDFAPGGADSIWIDIGAPVMTAADGRKYKMLVAPLILALDGRIDLNAIGNIMGAGAHRSHQGWGAWEVNPSKVLNADQTPTTAPVEWANLFTGSPKNSLNLSRLRGKYDQGTPAPNPAGAPIAGSNQVRKWAQLDYNSMVDATGATSTGLALPAAGPTSYLAYPQFAAATFGNGGATENTNHASIFNALRPRGTNLRFPAESMAQMLRFGGTGGDMLVSDPMRLLPQNLIGSGLSDTAARRRRNLVTLLSSDLDRPGATPYRFDTTAVNTNATRYQLLPQAAGAPFKPAGLAVSQFPTLGTNPLPASSEFDASWRSSLAGRLRLDLYRQLTPYPVPLPPGPSDWMMDDTVARSAQVGQATADRQKFAGDIFNVLLSVTGAYDAKTAYDTFGSTSTPEYRASRYLAQLAVNIVDYVDSDDIITPFNWASFTGADKSNVSEWVYGVETPRLVINELYIQYDNAPGSIMGVAPAQKVDPAKFYNVNIWAELHNPMPSDGQLDTTAHLSTGNGANLAYRIVIADQAANAQLRLPENTLGDPNFGVVAPATNIRNTLDSWGVPATDPQSVAPGGGKFDWSANATKSDGFYVIGPTPTFDPNQEDPNLNAFTTAKRDKMSYQILAGTGDAANPVVPRPTVLLQRLINPSLKPQGNPALANFNPYVTVDYVRYTGAVNPVMDGRHFDTKGSRNPTVMTSRTSFGRNQPLTAAPGQRVAQAPAFTAPAVAPLNQPKHTFSRQNCTFDNQAALNLATAAPPAGSPPGTLPTPQTLRIPFDWLVHLDRLPTNPLELLQVSETRPHDLTQRFYMGGNPQKHIAPWFDTVPSAPLITDIQSARLYRFFEFVTTPTPGTGGMPTAGGRVAGKVNINIANDAAIFRALADAQSGNAYFVNVPPPPPPPMTTSDDNVDAVFKAFINRRGTVALGSPPAPTDQTISTLSGLGTVHNPIWSLGLGQAAADETATPDPFLRTSSKTRGIENTLFQSVAGTPVFNVGGSHPYLQKELLRKIYASVTTRSNVFAVWTTVGYFEVDASTTPPRLGAEIGAAENRQVRHRMFSIVDRTQMQAWPTASRNFPTGPTVQSTTAIAIPTTVPTIPPVAPALTPPPLNLVSAAVSLQRDDGTVLKFNGPTNVTRADSAVGYAWTLQAGAVLVYEPNTDNEETVTVDSSGNATFYKNHAAGVAVVARANPGPLLRYDPRLDKDVVPYFGLID
jgi:hypothetical protein